MKMQKSYKHLLRLSAFLLAAGVVTACSDDDIDNSYSRNNSVIQLETSSDFVVLDETKPDEVALTLHWDAAYNYGNEYLTTYQYVIETVGSRAAARKEYEDDGSFNRSYTNRELHEMLVNHFGCLTSTVNTVNLTVTASFEGPRNVIPDIATATVRIKTYGAKQFLADELYIGGDAVGETPVQLTPTKADPKIYTWTGSLKAGKVNFPVTYGDESNAIGPDSADAETGSGEMPAVISDATAANYWIIAEDADYRVTVNLNNRTVKIVRAGSVIELDQLMMEGSAVGSEGIEMVRCYERDQLYAWRGELKAGTLFLPVMYLGAKTMTFAPADKEDHDIHDAQAVEVAQTAYSASPASYWTIPANGTYRVVIDLEERMATIYSEANDLKNTVVSYNNTVAGINPFTQEVTELWMWGGFNAAAKDDGLKAGFQSKFCMKQSVANPNVFVYKGENLPRSGSTDDWSKNTATGALNFLVSNIENNVYAYGSTVDAKRNDHRGYLEVHLGETLQLVPGQSDNRYAYFCVPENCNFVVVDIEKLQVTFDQK